MADLKAIPYVVSVDPDLAFDREQERHGTPLEFGHLNPEPLFPEPEPVPPSPRAEPTLENIENTIRFTDRLVQGIYTDADGPRPFMEKQSLLAALYQAHALQRIAAALEKLAQDPDEVAAETYDTTLKEFGEWLRAQGSKK